MNWDAFFKLHSDLPREGPGLPDDVNWAVRQAGTPTGARILDAGSGPGGDIEALLGAVPNAHVTAVDTHADFIETIVSRHAGDRVDARQSDMLEVVGPFDFIWCAGAIYFTGIAPTLAAWRNALAPGGHVAFTAPCYFSESPSAGAKAFWGEEPGLTLTPSEIEVAVASAGFDTLASRPLSDAAWEAYYAPMEARIAALRPTADAELLAVLDEGEQEISGWRAHREETGYWLSVVKPRA